MNHTWSVILYSLILVGVAGAGVWMWVSVWRLGRLMRYERELQHDRRLTVRLEREAAELRRDAAEKLDESMFVRATASARR